MGMIDCGVFLLQRYRNKGERRRERFNAELLLTGAGNACSCPDFRTMQESYADADFSTVEIAEEPPHKAKKAKY